MTVLYLTNNLQIAGTTRILLNWLKLGGEAGLGGCVVVQRGGELADGLAKRGAVYTTNSMRWLDWRWPFPALGDLWRLARWARRHGVDLVHCNEHDVYPFGVLVARLLRVPAVCHVRFAVERGFCQWAFGGWRRPDALLWTTNQQRLDCADAIAGIVGEDRQWLIPLGPDPRDFEAGRAERAAWRRQFDIRDDEVAIGTATALRPIKRIEDFVDVIASLAARDPRVVGLVAGGAVPGDEAYRATIEQRIAQSGLGRRLRWVGHVSPVQPFLHSLDVFVSTSEYETFGNSVCEAMACGLPVAAYVGGSVHEIIGEAGLVLPDRDLPGLMSAVSRFVEDPAVRAQYASLGRERVRQHFNPAESFRRLLGIYGRLLRTGPSAE